jgi:hypothetical protein
VISGLEKVDAVLPQPVNQAMLLRDPSTPAAGQFKPQGLRFANTDKRVAKYGLNEIEDSNGRFPVCLHPIAEIAPELRVEESLAITRQAPSPGAVC